VIAVPFTLLAGLLVAGDFARPAQSDQGFASAVCHVAFRFPASWTVEPDTTYPTLDADLSDTATASRSCTFRIRAAAWDSLFVEADSLEGVHTIWVQVTAQAFDGVLPMTAFERRDDGWIVGGRLGLENPATSIAGRGWRGIQGYAPVGCYRLGGGYAGACETPMALVAGGSHTVAVTGGPGTDDVFDRVLATLEVRP